VTLLGDLLARGRLGPVHCPDYALGHLIAFQVEAHFHAVAGPMGPVFERVTRIGSVDSGRLDAAGGGRAALAQSPCSRRRRGASTRSRM
jgi:hypothetical protein